MRRVLPATLLSAALALTTYSGLHAQNDRFAYAITDLSKDGAGWNAIRRLDLQSGQYSDVLLNGSDQQTIVFDATTKKQYAQPVDARYGNLLASPFSTGVAAAAYDKKHNRLYFTPMFIDQLRYVDLRTMKVYYVTGQAFTKAGNMHNDEGKIITRMVIAPDGAGYAISNDGNTFIRFSTGKKTKIEQLGSLVDDPANSGISVHNRCSSFGGDMIADDKGNLYILSARNHVFQVNTETKVATHLGAIQGLAQNFTVNGAVVDGDGGLLVSSAVDGDTYYVVNPKDWTAKPFKSAAGIFRSSDLANSNFLASERRSNPEPTDFSALVKPQDKYASLISVYPNPVATSRVTVQFGRIPAGDYIVELRDALGRSVVQKKINVNMENQTQSFAIEDRNAKGIYLIKVFDVNKQSVFTQKIVVQ
jgi:hypothetical protein